MQDNSSIVEALESWLPFLTSGPERRFPFGIGQIPEARGGLQNTLNLAAITLPDGSQPYFDSSIPAAIRIKLEKLMGEVGRLDYLPAPLIVPEVKAMIGALGGKAASPPPTEPPKYLLNWREILIALGLRNNAEDRGRIRHLNSQYEGPIVIPKQGAQPKVDEAKLREWYDHLEVQWTVGHRPARDAQPTAAAQHPYGRNGTVAPEISGRVKGRRKDRRA